MFAPAFSTAPWVCLRCQARQIGRLRQTANARTPQKLHRQQRYSQAAATDDVVGNDNASDANPQEAVYSEERPYVYRHIQPHGRLIGKRGRRHRETSAPLAIASLDQPAEVIVLREIAEESEKPRIDTITRSEPANFRYLSRSATEQEKAPTQDEVDASIDELQPGTGAIPAEQHEYLHESLVERYNAKQLSKYLNRKLQLASIEGDTVHIVPEVSVKRQGRLQRSKWRTGITPLEQRHSLSTVIKKNKPSKSKPELASQIMELAWNVTTSTQEQEIGEMEVSLSPWQTTFLFDRIMDDRPMYQRLVASDLVLRVVEVKPYRPHNVIRITGRRQIAEQVAQRLETRLSMTKRMRLNLGVFRALRGTPGWPGKTGNLFTDEVLRDVGQRTQSVLEWTRDGYNLFIRSLSEADCQSARRLLLSFLRLPSRGTTLMKTITTGEGDPSEVTVSIPELMTSSLHARHRSEDLTRETLPQRSGPRVQVPKPKAQSSRRTDDDDLNSFFELEGESARKSSRADKDSAIDSSKGTQGLGRSLVNYLRSLAPQLDTGWFVDRSAERKPSSPPPARLIWRAQFCRILSTRPAERVVEESATAAGKPTPNEGDKDPAAQKDSDGEQAASTVVQPDLPGIDALLTYFRGDGRGGSSYRPEAPKLLAHLIPSPWLDGGYTRLSEVPRVELRYAFDPPVEEGLNPGVHLEGIKVVVDRQDVLIKIPSHTADFCCQRVFEFMQPATGDMALSNESVGKFTSTLQQSLLSDSGGSLVGEPFVSLKMPSWLISRNPEDKLPYWATPTSKSPEASRARADLEAGVIEIDYLLERFEQVQEMDFVPLGQRHPLLSGVDPDVERLVRTFPRNAFLRLRQVEAGAIGGSWSELMLMFDSSTESFSVHAQRRALADTALQITHLLSRFNSRTLTGLVLEEDVFAQRG